LVVALEVVVMVEQMLLPVVLVVAVHLIKLAEQEYLDKAILVVQAVAVLLLVVVEPGL
jgi:hypothetical protein